MATLLMIPGLGRGLSPHTPPQCIGGVLQGVYGLSWTPLPFNWSFPKAEVVSPCDQGLSQGMGRVSPLRQGAGWSGAWLIRPGAPQAPCSSPP